jgi:hypothetical protein
MHRTASYLLLFLLFAVSAGAQSATEAAYLTTVTNAEPIHDSLAANPETTKSTSLLQLMDAIANYERTAHNIGFTKAHRPINVHYFPGRSSKRALVIGGVHGTELASIEIANRLIDSLAGGDTPYYSVLILPMLFPDNAALAQQQIAEIGSVKNIGRYSTSGVADPNRQMPLPGKPYDPQTNTDALGRAIEYENGILLQLIQTYQPHRIVNIHAIRDTAQGGVYADPRTDAYGLALDFSSDSSLAIRMAQHILAQGGIAPGNRLDSQPTAVYYKDPPVAALGQWQPRSCHTACLPHNPGHGVTLGSWASTAVQDAGNTALNRPAIRLLTMEFPGYKRPQDYTALQQPYYEKQISLYMAAIQHIFLGPVFEEETTRAKN